MAPGGGCSGVGGCLLNGSCRFSSFDRPFSQEGGNREVRGLLHHVYFSLQGPPGQPGYPGAMGPPGLPVSKRSLALGYGGLVGWSGRTRLRQPPAGSFLSKHFRL